MEFGPKRGHFLFIFENFIKDFSLLIIALFIGAVQGDMEMLLENAGVLVVVLIQPVGRIVQYVTTTYTVDSEKLIVRGGLLKKKEMEVPLSTITTVDFSQNVLHQIFGVYRLNVDNAGNVGQTGTKVNMTFKKDDAFAVRELLIAGRTGLDGFNLGTSDADREPREKAEELQDCRNRVRASAADLILMGLLKSKMTFLIQLIALIFAGLAMFNVSEALMGKYAAEIIFTLGIGYTLLLVLAAAFVLAVVCGMAGSFIRYYGFEMLDNGEAIKIEYGLLTKKRYTIQKNRVSGFSYEQSFLMRLLKTGTLHLYAIGYGQGGEEGTAEEPILFPMIREGEVRSAMASVLPEMKKESPYTGAARGSLRYFYYGFGFFTAAVLLGVSIYCSVTVPYCSHLWIIGGLILLYSIAGRLQEYRHAGIYANADNVSLVRGGFNMTTIFVKSAHVESISAKTSRWKEKKGIAGVTVSYIAPLTSANQTVKNLPASCFDEVSQRLVY